MNDQPSSSHETSRREFIRNSTVAALGSAVAANFAFPTVSSGAGSETIKVGLIGCGGRGTGAASQALGADKNVALTAMGDAFPEQLQRAHDALSKQAGDKVTVAPDQRFTGLDAYEKVLNSGVDVVILATPPGFRPQHLRAAIEAGKHVFCEKPMATDSPGVRSVLESVEKAKQKKLALVAGFCWRYDYARREFFKRIHEGAIGDIKAIYSTYYTGPVKPMPPASKRPAGMSDVEWQVRNWYNFAWLGGDGLVEQCVHSIDKVAWTMRDVPPLKAVAVGGRQTPNGEGNIYDHIAVSYEYANGVRAFVGQRQISGCYSQTADYLMGTKGNGTIGASRSPKVAVEIAGENTWQQGPAATDMYQVEHNELFASIRAGTPINDGIRMSYSTLMAIMGRMAAYTGQEITWEQALNSEDRLVPENLKWDMALPITPMAISPGKTKMA